MESRSTDEPVFPLQCTVKSYAWGKVGGSSLVARLARRADPTFCVEETTPYAELWMGCHGSGPSRVVFPDGVEMPLGDWLAAHPESWGSRKQPALPFLFKVLSIRHALSIQVHPDAESAARLHVQRPDLYGDANHKPELLCPLSPFEALCGFRDTETIATFLTSVPELRACVGQEMAREFEQTESHEALRTLYTQLMTRSEEDVATYVEQLTSRLSALREEERSKEEHVCLRLAKQFPGDVGVFSVFLMNYYRLQPGEALFLGPNIIHAYISGDAVEVMACSDNVVRGGLTGKPKDVETLCQLLSYETKTIPSLHGEPRSDGEVLYSPNVTEFELGRLSLPPGTTHSFSPSSLSPFIMLIYEGCVSVRPAGQGIPGREFGVGSVLFVPAGRGIDVTTVSRDVCTLYRCGTGCGLRR